MLLEDMMRLDLEVILQGTSRQVIAMQIQSTLNDNIKMYK